MGYAPYDRQFRLWAPRDALHVEIEGLFGGPVSDLDRPNPIPLIIAERSGHEDILLSDQASIRSPTYFVIGLSR